MDLTVSSEINLIIVYCSKMLLCVQQIFFSHSKIKFHWWTLHGQVKHLENKKREFYKTLASEYLS
jgi:hypothetical protein